MAISTDGVTLNNGSGGAVIQTEDMPVGAQRGAPTQPVSDYELPASKIYTGEYGIDRGPVTRQNPLYVESAAQRQLAELAYLKSIDANQRALVTRGNERTTTFFSRGER